jgi:hypothetical protein
MNSQHNAACFPKTVKGQRRPALALRHAVNRVSPLLQRP